MFDLRDYQQKVYADVQDKIRSGFHRILVVMPCRTGKSYIFAKMAEQASERGGNTLVLIHRHELRDQHRNLIDSLNIKNTEIGMVITESHKMREIAPTVIITDEAHLSMAASYKKVIDMYPDAYVIGFTATPIRLDGKPLKDLYDCMVVGPTVSWAIENNFMSDFHYYVPQLGIDFSGLKKSRGDFTEASAEAIMMSDTVRAIYSDVIHEWERIAGTRQTIVYCVTIKHAEEMAARFRSAGYSAEAVSSKTPDSERDEIFSQFRSGDIQLLCNVGIISEGVTFDNVWCCLLLRPTTSHALYWQQAMRCMTYVDGKTAMIIDCVKNYERLPMLDDDIEWSLTDKAKRTSSGGVAASMKLCENCLSEIPAASKTCPVCGADLTDSPNGTELQELKEYNMVLLHRKSQMDALEKAKMKRMEAAKKVQLARDISKCRTYTDFSFVASKYHYKQGWAYIKYKEYLRRNGA